MCAAVFVVVFIVMPIASASVLLDDTDGDFFDSSVDNCPALFNPYQNDVDGDGVGDECDLDDAVDTADTGADLMVGTVEDDTLSGEGGDDALYGLAGNDTLNGGPGDDFIDGGEGDDDWATGGTGQDTFAFDPDVVHHLTITDFAPGFDGFRFPRIDDDPSDDPPIEVEFGGTDSLVVTFPSGATITFLGIAPGTVIGFGPPPVITETTESTEAPGTPATPITAVTPVVFPTLPAPPAVPDAPLPPAACVPGGSWIVYTSGFFNAAPITDDCINAKNNTTGVAGDKIPIFTSVDGATATTGDDGIRTVGVDDSKTILVSGDIGAGVFKNGASAGNDYIDNNGGDATLKASGDSQLASFQSGSTAGDDYVSGGNDNDTISGDTGAGAFTGGSSAGDDYLLGRGGSDTIVGDSLLGGFNASFAGDDVIGGGPDKDVLYGDTAAGGFVNASTAGNDWIGGGGAADRISGDTETGAFLNGSSAGNDVIDGGAGPDTIVGDAFTGVFNDSAAGDDWIDGGSGNDKIAGDTETGTFANGSSAGDDIIEGGAGNDHIFGDTVTGTFDATSTAGADTFVYDLAEGDFGDDTIHDVGRPSGDGTIVEDTVWISGVTGVTAPDDFVTLDARSTVVEGGGDVMATVYPDTAKTVTTEIGSITFTGLADGTIDSFADIDATPEVAVVVVP